MSVRERGGAEGIKTGIGPPESTGVLWYVSGRSFVSLAAPLRWILESPKCWYTDVLECWTVAPRSFEPFNGATRGNCIVRRTLERLPGDERITIVVDAQLPQQPTLNHGGNGRGHVSACGWRRHASMPAAVLCPANDIHWFCRNLPIIALNDSSHS